MAELNEYSALHNGALFFDRTDRMRLRVSGPKAAELVTGMVTNDVSALSPGEGQYAAALTPKGKIVADLRIFAFEDSLLIDTSASASAGWMEMVRKYINPRLAPYRDVTSELNDFGVFGRSARSVVAKAMDVDDKDLIELAPFSHITRPFADVSVVIARVPDLDLEGFDLFIPADAAGAVKGRFHTVGLNAGSKETWEIARIESGRPDYGVDMDESTLPQEANFDELGAISYTKGCYIGQETVARVHFRGHVNRFLRKLRFVTRPAPPKGSELVDETGKVVGEVKSSALSPRFGGIAIAMVRREIQPGTTLQARWAEGECSVQVEQNEKGATV